MGVFDEDGQEWTIERMLSQKITPENILEATKKIRPILSGLGPTHQCGVLADLVATWLAGHAPAARADVFEVLLLMIRELVPENEREIFGQAGHPSAGNGPDQTDWDAVIVAVHRIK